MSRRSGLTRYAEELHPEIVRDVLGWRDHPELGRLVAALNAHTRRKAFLDTWAEVLVARHLLNSGCDLQFEVPTPKGRRADFEVTSGGEAFFLHVKRVDTGRPQQRTLTVSSRLRYLERIRRPYIVGVRWPADVTDAQMQQFVTAAAGFIQRASVGDELSVPGENGGELGAVRIVAPWEGEHVSLVLGLPNGFVDEAPRIRRLMIKAYQQFMPSEVNVILICTSHADDLGDFETALLGAHVERWDAFPPRGRRVAHGRAEDGFWRGKRYAESHAAGWFRLDASEPELSGCIRYRSGHALETSMQADLNRLFNNEPS